MAVELPMFALRSRRACGECKTAEAMRILAIGRWGRVLHHVKCGGGGGGVGVGVGGWGWGWGWGWWAAAGQGTEMLLGGFFRHGRFQAILHASIPPMAGWGGITSPWCKRCVVFTKLLIIVKKHESLTIDWRSWCAEPDLRIKICQDWSL